MKRCPTCQSTYTDDSLRFCLQDGSKLVRVSDAAREPEGELTVRDHLPGWPSGEQATPTEVFEARNVAAPTLRISTPPSTGPAPARATAEELEDQAARAPSSSNYTSSNSKMKAALIALTALLATSIVLAIVLWRRSSGQNGGGTNTISITASASSTRATFAGNTYDPSNVLDGRLITAWAEGASGPGIGEWIRCDFGREVTLNRISIAPGYFKSQPIWARNNRLAAATISFSDGTSRSFRFPDRMEEQILEVGAVRTNWVRIVIDEVYEGTDPDTSISQLAFEFAK